MTGLQIRFALGSLASVYLRFPYEGPLRRRFLEQFVISVAAATIADLALSSASSTAAVLIYPSLQMCWNEFNFIYFQFDMSPLLEGGYTPIFGTLSDLFVGTVLL